jgi:ABC-type bacteriocin/lantibiotic exporter with double-glycine peptidase domain
MKNFLGFFSDSGQVPGVRPLEGRDCGPACLSSVARYYGLLISVIQARMECGSDPTGTSLLGLKDGAERLGFAARGVSASPEDLDQMPLPAIVLMSMGEASRHYWVLDRVGKKNVQVMDPSLGMRRSVSRTEFCSLWTGYTLLLTPLQSFRKGRLAKSPLGLLGSIIAPHFAVLAQVAVGAFINALLTLAGVIFLQKIIDNIALGGQSSLLPVLGSSLLAIVFMSVLMQYLQHRLLLAAGTRLDAALCSGYYGHLFDLPLAYYDSVHTGELLARMEDSARVRRLVTETLLPLFMEIFRVPVCLLYFSLTSPGIFGLCMMAICAYLILIVIRILWDMLLASDSAEQASHLQAHLTEALGAIGTLKRANMESWLKERTENRLGCYLMTLWRGNLVNGALAAAQKGIVYSLAIGVLWYGATLVMKGSLHVGQLAAAYLLLLFLFEPIDRTALAFTSLFRGWMSLRRLFEIMDLASENLEGQNELFPEGPCSITFDHASLRYRGKLDALHDVSFTVAPGSFVAVVGESGSGKSTLLSALQGLYPLSSGDIRFGAVPLGRLKLSSLRDRVVCVPQKVDILNVSIEKNIALGDPFPDRKRVEDIADLLGIRDFIERLPSGFDSSAGEGGSLLSGGQRQRLGIARALYRNPSLLLLDEATSALDPLSEQQIFQALMKLKEKGCTLIVVTHRLRSIVNADNILVMESGRLVEEGRNAELHANKKLYYRLVWQSQGVPTDVPMENVGGRRVLQRRDSIVG